MSKLDSARIKEIITHYLKLPISYSLKLFKRLFHTFKQFSLDYSEKSVFFQRGKRGVENFRRTLYLYQSVEKLNNDQKYQQGLAELSAKSMAYMYSKKDTVGTKNLSKHKPLISIIMPVWNREALLTQAIESVQKQCYEFWELIIVDDGSTDNTKEVIAHYLADKRIAYYKQKHLGVCFARNYALERSKGEIIAYLDSDNFFLPHTLTIAVKEFLTDPSCQALNFAAIWDEPSKGIKSLNFAENLDYNNQIIYKIDGHLRAIDTNCFLHRRKLYEEYGGFDVQLTRYTDYELTFRYQLHAKIKPLPFIGVHYRHSIANNTITIRNNSWYNLYLIRKKYESPKKSRNLKVLYALNHYPQVTESYMYTEIDYMQRQGVYVEVWSQHEPKTPFPTQIKVHKGSIKDAINHMQPDLIQSHWLTTGLDVAKEVKNMNLSIPITIRTHGFEYNHGITKTIAEIPQVKVIYSYPHLYEDSKHLSSKIKSMCSCFNPNRYYPPSTPKDRKMVLRVGACLITKDIECFIRVAAMCQQHRFVLIFAHCTDPKSATHPDALIQLNQKLGNPVDIRIDMMPDEITKYVQQAGIYFHTHFFVKNGGTPYGMPISICESMATGSYVIGRYCEASAAYIGDAAQCYSTDKEAAKLINATLDWDDDTWYQQQQHAIDRAYEYFLDDRALSPMLEDWLEIKAMNQPKNLDSKAFTYKDVGRIRSEAT